MMSSIPPNHFRLKLEFPQPAAPHGACAAAAGYVARGRGQMVDQVVIVGVLLEMVAAAVGHDAPVDDMDLPDRPTVELRFREKLFQERMVTDLHVASAHTQPFDEGPRWDRLLVVVVEYPAYGGRITVQPWNPGDINTVKGQCLLAFESKMGAVWPVEGCFRAVDADFEGAHIDQPIECQSARNRAPWIGLQSGPLCG